MTVAASTIAAVRRIPFGAFDAFPLLFETYCTAYEALDAFYAGDFRRAEVRADAARRAAEHPRDRAALVDVLLEQNARWGLDDATRANIEALRRPETVAVVTGQQVGLFTGPLYTPYKTITTLQLARRLQEETGRPVVPVFWLEGEDHDFDEVAAVRLLQRNELVEVRYAGHTPPEGGNLGPVGRLVLTGQIDEVLAAVEAALAPSDFRDGLMERVRDAYRPGVSLLDAFARLMRAFFPEEGLVFISPDDARLKRLAAPLFRREIADHATVQARFEAVSARLSEHYHAQVHARPTNLFLLEDNRRYALDAEGTHFRLRGTDRLLNREDLLARLDEHPGCFSPNVILRPLMQDTLLPTAVYVAGPGEVSYFAQLKPVYEWAGVPMPVVYPRASATLVESKVKKVLAQHPIDVPDLAEEADRLFRRVVLDEMEVDVEAVFQEAVRHLHTAVNTFKPVAERVDRSLGKAAEATRAALAKEFARLKERVLKAEKRHHDTLRQQLHKARVNLFPDGKLQERVLSPLYFLNKYSPALLVHLRNDLDLDTTEHQIVEL
ncbi:bacillithiol biosynthesis cysteine-adding enzyme BshC [Rhodocaloribacter litoris]|uniref:bacillithiol biosynthesis cysteine-adding enzyme BshC n=1 Tax=Rhodocaloribacter litoris TaxID=2558931 RepID=UPI00142497BC|nr:bacillithiol biosynthesis cysteine-adding enzyme BshC [Rhodocaloribacter litoris]QXD14441.1 bacillithiol biosynthesis cysteine-adding enzyme BshC [Rhodocaloribacter litoris]